MSDSDSDASFLAKYLESKNLKTKTTTKTANNGSSSSSSSNDKKKPAAAGPKISHTGSQKQPLSLETTDDDNDSDSDCGDSSVSSSMLEVLPKKKATTKAYTSKTAATSLAAASKRKAPTSTKATARSVVSATAKSKSVLLLGDSSDSDSDDSLLKPEPLLAKKPGVAKSNSKSKLELEKERKKRDQEGKKLEQLAQKQAEQARKKIERETLKLQKQVDKQVATDSRKRQRLEQQQARGNFFSQEIVLLVDPPLFRRPQEHPGGCYDWKEHEEVGKHACLVQEYQSVLGGRDCHALQWIRRDYLQGGATEAWQQLRQNNVEGYTHLDRLVIVMDDPKVFLQLLQRTSQDNDDDDYPQLRRWLARVEHGWKAAWPHSKSSRPKMMLLLHRGMDELDKQWIAFRKANKNNARRDAAVSPPSSEEFHDAMTWMLIQFQVECMCCDNYEEIWTTALKMTRAIARAPYHHLVTELECIKKAKSQVADSEPALVRAKDVWMRQLQQIPGISENGARNLVRHYPTVQSLWQAYGESPDDPQDLIAGCLSDKTYQQKKSESIHRLLTSQNPEEFI